ncbi:MAG TPA: nitrogenase [Cyanobacteria bacterium UBA11162]|nr:nitrogenase [Cyanobacteria bacterium UBA12227]HAX86842.1 nitrogenase [Cyanobacteria bacterium UBA11370]HBL14583.1 nitrogenase [Cyanobacteria bacterium UBA11162]HBY75530.1 nitrogenase [Cyanobacteria bacterium UBA11148]
MTVTQSPYTTEQIAAWLRGLFTVAWADGHFDPEEQEVLAQVTQDELAATEGLPSLEQQISPEELAAALGKDPATAENFVRTAVMVALADGVYSVTEADILHQFTEALGLKVDALEALRLTLYDGQVIEQTDVAHELAQEPGISPHPHSDVLQPVREWLDGMDVQDPRVARFICKMIPSQCPFERDVTLFGQKIVHIPAMCKINPLYEQLVGLRFRALSYLADDRGEDISPYL